MTPDTVMATEMPTGSVGVAAAATAGTATVMAEAGTALTGGEDADSAGSLRMERAVTAMDGAMTAMTGIDDEVDDEVPSGWHGR